MYECKSWTVKKAELWIIDAFELWCWRRLLRVPWTERRSNQSILKTISTECPLEGLILKLKFQYFGHLMGRADSFEKTLMLGKIEEGRWGDDRGWDGWMASPVQWIWVWVNSRSWWWTGRTGVLQFMGSQRVRHNWATELNWTVTETTQEPSNNSATQYSSKFGKLSSGYKTVISQLSFQFQRRAMPKNVQTIALLCSFHILVM